VPSPLIHRLQLPMAAALFVVKSAACSDGDSGVTTAAVTREDVQEVVEAPGSVTAVASATVSASATGTVSQLLVTEGQQVNAGDVLFVVDSPQARQSLAQAQEADAALDSGTVVPEISVGAEQRAARREAAEGFERSRVEAGLITDPELRSSTLLAIDNAESQYNLAIASADALAEQVQAGVAGIADAVDSLSAAQRVQTQAAIVAAQAGVDALTVRAPIAGAVSLTAADPGSGTSSQLADAAAALGAAGGAGTPDLGSLLGGDTSPDVSGLLRLGQPVASGQPLLTITDASALSVTAQVDETDVLLVSSGTQTEILLDAIPGETFESEVSSIDPAPTASARGGVAFTVRAPLTTSGPERPLPGMSAIVRLVVREAPNVPVVPASAVIRRDGGNAVWAVDDDGRARLREVELGVLGDGVVEVRDGLAAGDTIVATGADRVSEGQGVQ